MVAGQHAAQRQVELSAFHELVKMDTTFFAQPDLDTRTRSLEPRKEAGQNALHRLRCRPEPQDAGASADEAPRTFDQ
jgi:hypothetical protein